MKDLEKKERTAIIGYNLLQKCMSKVEEQETKKVYTYYSLSEIKNQKDIVNESHNLTDDIKFQRYDQCSQ